MAWPEPGDATPTARYRDDGAVALGRVLDDAELAAARAAFDAVIGDGFTGSYATIVHDAWRRAPTLAALVPRLAARACAASGAPGLVLFHDHLLWKPPGGDDMAWHQDYSYLPLDRPDGLTLWIALDDITAANGCLYYVPGSHRWGERRAAWGMLGDDDPRATLPPIDVADGEPGVAAPTPAGCAIAHDALVWHRSPRNTSGAPRRSWALSLVSPDARWSPRHAPHPRSAVSPRAEGDPLEPELIRVGAC